MEHNAGALSAEEPHSWQEESRQVQHREREKNTTECMVGCSSEWEWLNLCQREVHALK
jgi:hypothetical protein